MIIVRGWRRAANIIRLPVLPVSKVARKAEGMMDDGTGGAMVSTPGEQKKNLKFFYIEL